MKVLFYSDNCQFCKEILKKLDESKLKDEIKIVCIDNTEFPQVKIVPTIIDSNYKEILEGKKAFDYLKNKDFFDFPTNNFLSWKEKEVPNPKIEKDKLAYDTNENTLLDKVEFDNLNVESSDNNNSKANTLKDVKLNKTSAALLRRRR